MNTNTKTESNNKHMATAGKKNNAKSVKLTGDDHKKATQLYEYLGKCKEITAEELKSIIPMTTHFITAFVDVLKEQTNSERCRNEAFYNTMNNLSNALSVIISDGVIDKEERIKIIEILQEIPRLIHDIENRKTDADNKFKKILALCSTIFVSVVLGVFGLKKNN